MAPWRVGLGAVFLAPKRRFMVAVGNVGNVGLGSVGGGELGARGGTRVRGWGWRVVTGVVETSSTSEVGCFCPVSITNELHGVAREVLDWFPGSGSSSENP